MGRNPGLQERWAVSFAWLDMKINLRLKVYHCRVFEGVVVVVMVG